MDEDIPLRMTIALYGDNKEYLLAALEIIRQRIAKSEFVIGQITEEGGAEEEGFSANFKITKARKRK